MRSDSVSKMKNEQQWKKREQEHKIEFFCKCEKKIFEGKYDISSIKGVTRKLHVLVVQQQQHKKVCWECKVVCFG